MPRLVHRTPAYSLHRRSGQAVIQFDNQTIYLGPYGTKASRAEYDRVIAEYLANGRHFPVKQEAVTAVTVNDVILAFWKYVKGYYRYPDGSPTTEQVNINRALSPVTELYGRTAAVKFGPLALQAVQQKMAAMGRARKAINRDVHRIKLMFRWAVSRELIPATVSHALATVTSLKEGRAGFEVKESEPVKPVSEVMVEATLPFLSPQVRAMVEIQLLTGMRPGELMSMRTADIDRSRQWKEVPMWVYTPRSHKNSHRGHVRRVPIGPKGQEKLLPFLKLDPNAFVFSPAEAEEWHRAKRYAERKTPMSCGNRPGTNKKTRPQRRPSDHYTRESYRRAIARACEVAFKMPKELRKASKDDTPEQRAVRRAKAKEWRAANTWHPHQLRHGRGTEIRRDFGIEAAQMFLGHKNMSATEVYAERNEARVMEIAAAVG